MAKPSLVPRPSLIPVFDRLQYCKRSKTGAGEGLGKRLGKTLRDDIFTLGIPPL